MSNVPHDNFAAGFIVGWQAIKGINAGIPSVPGQPGIWGNSTPFLTGVKKGIEKALGRPLD